MFKSAMLDREYLAKRFANLSHRRYLPVKVPAADSKGKGLTSPRAYTSTPASSSENLNLAELNLRLSAVFVNCWGRGK
jgi:hypothetical protein